MIVMMMSRGMVMMDALLLISSVSLSLSLLQQCFNMGHSFLFELGAIFEKTDRVLISRRVFI